jgi:putative oxidoreductase
MINTLTRYAPVALALLRIVTALLFMEHGTQKLFGFPAMQSFGPPPDAGADGGGEGAGGPPGGMMAMMMVAGWLELVGGLAILLGLFTRPVAFILAGEMAVAYWLVHFGMGGFFPINNGGEAAILFCFTFLYLVFAGPGAWAVDNLLGRRQPVAA